jgi:hypothetical protein
MPQNIMTEIEIEKLQDLMFTIRNATLIADVLINTGNEILLPTILEYIHENNLN